MLLRESLCTSLVNNETDIVLLGITSERQVAVFGPDMNGYLVDRDELSADSNGHNYQLSLSDRYEIEPQHLFLEWYNVTLFDQDDDITNAYLEQDDEEEKPNMVLQTTSRRITLTRETFEAFSENLSPPDGVVFLSRNRWSNKARSPLAIRNLQDKFCLIDHWSQFENL